MDMNQLTSTFLDACLYGLKLSNIYNSVYLRAFQKAVTEERKGVIEAAMGGGGKGTISYNTVESIYNKWLKNVDEELEAELKSEHFTSLLSRYTRLLLEQRSIFRKAGYPVDYLDRLFDWYVRSHLVFSLIPKESHLAPYDVVYRKGKARLLHYRAFGQEAPTAKKQPLLIIYAPINTFHILDLNPRRSVVRDLLTSDGLDIYLLDWGYPDWNDNHLSLEDYLGYVNDAVIVVKDQTKENKISILGYCWGGIFALIHAALNPEEVRNLVLMAVPIDFSKDDTILARWSKVIDVDAMMDEFGHMDGQALDLGFLMRNPPRYGFDKYLKLFQKTYDSEFVDTFIDVERWLYDTPPIPGVLHRQIINDCYKNNLLVSGGMEIAKDGKKQKVNLKKISVPVLSIIAEKDDLVSPASSAAINDYISSQDKSVLNNPGGHVALCISSNAHRKLWPEVAKWLLSR
ncbi:poly(R)-hydroxyalkanoic acid synthase [Candidatus Nitrososphaera gargensis Ga9.2]|uniref:Poly(R)-hydroxyalkanoic acid synthase n=2 Tax=Candidatus Nitrososphaera gargensis TaxID=497727 RepID=K0IKI7_NITGG|nr:poly(R)-hydroxyalkanoic acid synthase [Candidatus Nitrososphaera gargensis Ga9.2]